MWWTWGPGHLQVDFKETTCPLFAYKGEKREVTVATYLFFVVVSFLVFNFVFLFDIFCCCDKLLFCGFSFLFGQGFFFFFFLF